MKHFITVLILFIVPIVAIALVVFLTIDTPVTLTDSGSTNSESFALTVNPDGSGYDNNGNDSTVNYFDSGTFDYKRLVDAIRTKNTLIELFITRPSCPHSVSFGTTQTITYNWISSGDATCVSDQNFHETLQVIENAAHVPVMGFK